MNFSNLIVILLILFSCELRHVPPIDESDRIVGYWKSKSIYFRDSTNEDGYGVIKHTSSQRVNQFIKTENHPWIYTQYNIRDCKKEIITKAEWTFSNNNLFLDFIYPYNDGAQHMYENILYYDEYGDEYYLDFPDTLDGHYIIDFCEKDKETPCVILER